MIGLRKSFVFTSEHLSDCEVQKVLIISSPYKSNIIWRYLGKYMNLPNKEDLRIIINLGSLNSFDFYSTASITSKFSIASKKNLHKGYTEVQLFKDIKTLLR